MLEIIKNRLRKGEEYKSFETASYSQEGEDIFLKKQIFYKSKEPGFYVDIGAYHPFKFSNTFLFYKNGWNGINIDAMPGSMILFNKYRKRDINIECGISNDAIKLNYYIYREKAYNTFSDKQKEYNFKYGIKPIKIKKIDTKPLFNVLDEFISNRTIDFMSIDAEGYDINVLKSNDWRKYRPKIIICETQRYLTNNFENEYTSLMKSMNYQLLSKFFHSIIFISNEFSSEIAKNYQ